MHLVGVDVGFAKDRATSGVSSLSHLGDLVLGHATSAWEDRKRVLGSHGAADVTAIDAPIVPAQENHPRYVERILSAGSFQRRCKPGASHVPGTGRELRAAGKETANQFASVTSGLPLGIDFPRVLPAVNIVEAFPNAFLGVCLDESIYARQPQLKRGRKFDWLYDCWITECLFQQIAAALNLAETEVVAACVENTHHEERAALICLLTAASVAAGHYVAIGDSEGGYIFLPGWDFWAEWARAELRRQHQRVPSSEVWIDGVRHEIPNSSL